MGNQQNLSPRVAERVFEAVFPSLIIWFFSSSVGKSGRHRRQSQVRVLSGDFKVLKSKIIKEYLNK